MTHLYTIDTVAFIDYYDSFFQQGSRISASGIQLINKAFDPYQNTYKLVIPSIVFVEIYEKFLKTEELKRQFYYNIFVRIKENPDIYVMPIEKETLRIYFSLKNILIGLENHDKLIVSSALQLNSPLITCDSNIKDFSKACSELSIIQ